MSRSLDVMNLRERLNQMRSGDRIPSTPVNRSPLPYLTPLENKQGLTYYCDKIFIDYHGQIDLKQFPEIAVDTLRFLSQDRTLADFSIRDVLFLDIETTGTAGGTGTYAFLVGFGFVEEGYFQVRQFFLHDLAQESAFLNAIEEFSGKFRYLVTYNGKTFDSQILRNRYLMHRKEDPLKEKPHVDMLFIARRLWKKRFRECDLMNLERNLLNFYRLDDIPGYLIPSVYTDYLRFARANLMQKVIHHNQWDIVSLAVLTARASRLQQQEDLTPEEHFSLSLLFEKQKDPAKAVQHQLLALAGETHFRRAILFSLARNLRRMKDQERIQWLVDQAENIPMDDLLCRQICILCEHDLKDFTLALKYAQLQMQKLEKYRGLSSRFAIQWNDWDRRRARLQRKCEVSTARC
ncbi:ribonuclease H-like domain-containing protein [bacterium]|nr:ribonuclease H-like domain-containing protein [bacterium]